MPESKDPFIGQGTRHYHQEAGASKRPNTSRSSAATSKRQWGRKKGRLACFQLSATRGASEHSDPLPREAEHVLNGSEVVDLRTLFLFRGQKKADMPGHLREATGRVWGGYRASKQNLRDVAKLLGMSTQAIVAYPDGDKNDSSLQAGDVNGLFENDRAHK